MKILFEKFCEDNYIDFITEGKNVSARWIQICCPFCGDHSHHLGFHAEYSAFKCWRCGKHTAKEVFTSISKIPFHEIREKYYGKEGRPSIRKSKEKASLTKISLPKEFQDLSKPHKTYLTDRNFDWQKIKSLYNIMGTGPIGSWKNRIIMPVYHDGILATYTSRDITDKSDQRYKACSAINEAREIKHCLYGYDMIPGKSVIVVEGPTDVWRLGPGSVATFGTEFKMAQVNLLKKFKNVFILFDPGAEKNATKLADNIWPFTDVEIVEIDEDDPGSMSQKDADDLMKELIL